MTANELAFLALGLILGAATGAALIVVLGTRSPRREIRVTVTRDAVPRRSGTLSQDAFVTSPAQPARGGPGDRRWYDRDGYGPLGAGAGEEPPSRASAPLPRSGESPRWSPIGAPDRTPVPSIGGALAARIRAASGGDPVPAVGIAVRAEQAAAVQATREVQQAASDAREIQVAAFAPDPVGTFERILRGEHRAMVEVVDRIAGEDSARRREWELLLDGLVEAMADMAVGESVIAFPMGTPFWDAFTVEQCRRIVSALGSMGYHYDGRSGWTEQRVPSYRDLSQALADIGVDPRRMRAWPTQADIAMFFVGARPAPEELLAAAGPDYAAADVQGLIGERATELGNLWLAWDVVRPLLFDAQRPAEGSRPD